MKKRAKKIVPDSEGWWWFTPHGTSLGPHPVLVYPHNSERDSCLGCSVELGNGRWRNFVEVRHMPGVWGAECK